MQIVGASACVIFILLQKIQKMVKCTFWYRLTWVVPDKVQRAVKWLCVCVFYRQGGEVEGRERGRRGKSYILLPIFSVLF